MIYCFDLDGTLCRTDGGDYEHAEPIWRHIEEVRRLKRMGHEIRIRTARGSETGTDWRELTEQQLERWNVPYDMLRVGALYADVYVDDRALPPTTFFA